MDTDTERHPALDYLQQKHSTEAGSSFQDTTEEIVDQLKVKGVEVTDSFVEMTVKLVSMEPRNLFLIKATLDPLEVDRLKKLVTERILSMSEGTRNTIRVQLHYKANCFKKEAVVEAHHEWLEDNIQQPMESMTKTVPKHTKHFDAYYEKLLLATIFACEMGEAKNMDVLKETYAALQSIFPKGDISLLATMPEQERELELRHRMKMAAGIRLYNWDLNPGSAGVGIPDLPKLLSEKLAACMAQLSKIRSRNLHRLILYTAITKPYFLDEKATTNSYGRREFSEDMIFIRHGLIMVHQLLVYLKEISDALGNEEVASTELVTGFQTSLSTLRKTMEEKEHVATMVIYPKFIEVATAWDKIQDSLLYAETLELLLGALLELSEPSLAEIDKRLPEIVDLPSIMKGLPSEEEFFTFPQQVVVDDPHSLVRRVRLSLKDIEPSKIQYAGFCPWALVKGYGLPLLSNPILGVYHWKGRQYLISSAEVAAEFSRNPDDFVHKAVHVARRWPQLIYLLHVEDEVFNQEAVQAAERATTGADFDAKISTEMSVQTELHPIESNIVQGYSWNEWELRKQAIILSNIHKCATHSTQTIWQSRKKTQEIQTYSARDQRTQTDQNKYVEAPRNQFYFYGLRGLHCDPPHIVELTREPVEELRCLVKPEPEPLPEPRVKKGHRCPKY